MKDADDYAKTYRNILPSEITEGFAVRIKTGFQNVLEEHPRTMRRIENITR